MAFDAEEIRATGQRVAASHGLDVVDIEFLGGAKHRTLRVFIEKNAEERRKQIEADPGLKGEAEEGRQPTSANTGQMWGTRMVAGLDQLAGVTHEDCEAFSRDFGTVLDVEDLIPGGEYTLEVSSPGLDRRLRGIEDYRRFQGMLTKVQTFEPVAGNRHWQGRLTEVNDASVKLTRQGAGKKQGKGNRQQGTESAADVEIALSNIEKAHLMPEF
jgi:ribosome maturation factor RimP